ncbi:hypothetical protein [Compostibacter hankyongensis]|uniref:DoxX family membrane protein n=1 Tax=Compostibacter hankyongensis TaxID=1007089 RepID=A0ABP8G9B5_9BACT
MKISRQRAFDYFILAARISLAYTLIKYGQAKLTGGQFGVSPEELNTPLKDLSLFRLSWYLADHEPFKSFIGICQIITAGLLLYSRTCIMGALMSIPIWLNILVWDMTFMGLLTPFVIRIPYYLLLTFLILWHYREKLFPALHSCTEGMATRYVYPLWAWLVLPLAAFCVDLASAPLMAAFYFLKVMMR